MEFEIVLELVDNYGYLGLFLWLWIGVFGIPVPNEVIVMTVAMLSSTKIINPFYTFLVVYAGIVAALTTCYSLGKFLGRPFLYYFRRKKKFTKGIHYSLKLIDKYHAASLLIGYFIPGIRNLLPFLYGFSKLSFKTFAFFAYAGALIWVSIVYSIGYLFGDHIEVIISYGTEIMIVLVAVFILFIFSFFILRKRKRRKKRYNLE
ncbi:DedA family protein [Bacillus sp. 03113]|uniref:DedA family protein n=1 Tax=Bacillus sp. 03113 TaxID=2578211 RepID=UPI0011436186|nr:DedA family protein [Bacillus sp. 03113]